MEDFALAMSAIGNILGKILAIRLPFGVSFGGLVVGSAFLVLLVKILKIVFVKGD